MERKKRRREKDVGVLSRKKKKNERDGRVGREDSYSKVVVGGKKCYREQKKLKG